jgi:hypothetical protein
MRLDIQQSAQQGLTWHSLITPSWASSISHRPLSCRFTTRMTSRMCGPRVSFNAARRVQVLVVSITQGISLESVDFAVPWAQFRTKWQRCCNTSHVATRTASDNSGSTVSDAGAIAPPPTLSETSAITHRQARLPAVVTAQGRPRFIQ